MSGSILNRRSFKIAPHLLILLQGFFSPHRRMVSATAAWLTACEDKLFSYSGGDVLFMIKWREEIVPLFIGSCRYKSGASRCRQCSESKFELKTTLEVQVLIQPPRCVSRNYLQFYVQVIPSALAVPLVVYCPDLVHVTFVQTN